MMTAKPDDGQWLCVPLTLSITEPVTEQNSTTYHPEPDTGVLVREQVVSHLCHWTFCARRSFRHLNVWLRRRPHHHETTQHHGDKQPPWNYTAGSLPHRTEQASSQRTRVLWEGGGEELGQQSLFTSTIQPHNTPPPWKTKTAPKLSWHSTKAERPFFCRSTEQTPTFSNKSIMSPTPSPRPSQHRQGDPGEFGRLLQSCQESVCTDRATEHTLTSHSHCHMLPAGQCLAGGTPLQPGTSVTQPKQSERKRNEKSDDSGKGDLCFCPKVPTGWKVGSGAGND